MCDNTITNATMDENTNVMPILPKFTREFARSMEFLLPLRMSCRSYREDGGVVTIFEESPETDENQGVSGEMYAMTVRPAIVGHAAYVKPSEKESGFMQVREPVYEHMNTDRMMNAIRVVNSGSLKWVNKYGNVGAMPISPPNAFMERSSIPYQAGLPLAVYTNVAAVEAANHSADSNFWRNLYPPLELIECHYGSANLMYDNNVLSMGEAMGSDDSPFIEMRRPSEHHRGFIDTNFTPQSKGAGRVRMLAFGVSIRVMTKRTVEMACKLLSAVGHSIGTGFGDWVLRCMGFTSFVTSQDVIKIVNEWKNMCEFNMPTVHVFTSMKVIVISITSGVLIRPVRTSIVGGKFVKQGPFVDSMCIYHSDTMKYLDVRFPDPEIESMQFTASILLLFPFHRFTTEPRPNLGMQMIMQGLNVYPVKGDATVVSLGVNEPIVKTEFMSAIEMGCGSEYKFVLPGKNAVVAFVNRTQNTEDACTVAEEFADWGSFAWMGYIDYPIPRGKHGKIEPGMVLDLESWWKPALKGLVTKVFMNKSGGTNATVAIYSKGLVIGDKLATYQGIKFTVGEKIPYKDMPLLVDEKTGEKFRPSVLIQTKNLARGIGGQVREMSASMSLFPSVAAFRMGVRPTGRTTFSHTDELTVEPRIPSAFLTHNGKKVSFKEESGATRVVKCGYGIMRLLHLRHTPLLKQHYPSSATTSVTVPRGRYREGTPRTGETELLSMMMQGMNLLTAETVKASDDSYQDVCSICRALPFFCDCPSPKPDTTKITVRYSATQLNVYVTLAQLNDGKGNAMTMRYHTST